MKPSLLLATLALLGVSSATAGIIVSLVPQPQTVSAGASSQVQVRIAGLGSDTPPSLGAFDFNLAFDPTFAAFTGITFGDPLRGDQLDLTHAGPLNGSSMSPGSVEFFEISFDLASTLDTLQPSSFVLATLTIRTLRSGTATLTPSLNSVADAQGATLPLSFQTTTLTATTVPEPGTFSLLAGAVGSAFVVMARSRRS